MPQPHKLKSGSITYATEMANVATMVYSITFRTLRVIPSTTAGSSTGEAVTSPLTIDSQLSPSRWKRSCDARNSHVPSAACATWFVPR